VFPDREVALKTGTTNNYRDAWTIGYTPSLVAGVWAGNNDNTPMHKRGSSILAAVPIWHAFMSEALKLYPNEVFARPAPTSPSKPILAGDYLANNQLHSILWYVNRNNPTGPVPTDPSADPQFANWETSVLAWAKNNIATFSTLNQIGTSPAQSSLYAITPGAPRIEIKTPQAGAYMTNEVSLGAQIESSAPLARILVYWNGGLVQDVPGNYPQSHYFGTVLIPSSTSLQNLLEIEVVDATGRSSRAGVVVYK
jgi:penicillin-binding protein 1A